MEDDDGKRPEAVVRVESCRPIVGNSGARLVDAAEGVETGETTGESTCSGTEVLVVAIRFAPLSDTEKTVVGFVLA